MSERTPSHVREHPLPGDVIEIREPHLDEADGTSFDYDTMLRVVSVHEDRVWFKEYGKGHRLVCLKEWQERLDKASMKTLLRGADHDAPF